MLAPGGRFELRPIRIWSSNAKHTIMTINELWKCGMMLSAKDLIHILHIRVCTFMRFQSSYEVWNVLIETGKEKETNSKTNEKMNSLQMTRN
jgi:hypothetical protein